MTAENSIKLGKDDSSVFSVTTINSNVLYRYSLKIAGLPTLWTRCTAVRTVCAMSSKEAPVHPNEE